MSLKPIKIGDLLQIKFELWDALLKRNTPRLYCIYLAEIETNGKYTYFLQGTKEDPGFIDRFLVLETKENVIIVYSLLFKEKLYVSSTIFEYFVTFI